MEQPTPAYEMGDSSQVGTKRGPGRPPKSSSLSSSASTEKVASIEAAVLDTDVPLKSSFTADFLLALQDPRVVVALRDMLCPGWDSSIEQLRGEMKQLRDQAEELAKEVASLRSGSTSALRPVDMDGTYAMVAATSATVANPSLNHRRPPSPPPLTLVSVHKELEEKRRRATNVIVHGLPPRDGVGDEITFSRFMEEHLRVKPAFDGTKCRRLGKAQNGKPQPLLVVFNNTMGAADVLASTGDLRRSAPSVFINADLTRAEAQLAYEERARRRERRQQRPDVGDAAASATASASQMMTANSTVVAPVSTTPSMMHASAHSSNSVPTVQYSVAAASSQAFI